MTRRPAVGDTFTDRIRNPVSRGLTLSDEDITEARDFPGAPDAAAFVKAMGMKAADCLDLYSRRSRVLRSADSICTNLRRLVIAV